jgi:hypothetical protein
LIKPPAPKPAPPPAALAAAGEAIRPADWREQQEGDARLDGSAQSDGKRVLTISTRNPSTASWRSDIKLNAGRYRFEGRVRTLGVLALRDEKGVGAGLRISGGSRTPANKLEGDTNWTGLSQEFEVPSNGSTVTLVCELRAQQGQALFDLESLRVVLVSGSR